MATTICLFTEKSPHPQGQPDCDEASVCLWFETSGASPSCANRNSMVCNKRLNDVFAPHCDRYQAKVK